MKFGPRLISVVALAATIVPGILFIVGAMSHSAVTSTALIGTILWFIATPMWMGREPPVDTTEVEV